VRPGPFGYAAAAALVLALASGCSPTRSRVPDRPVEVPGAFSGAPGDRARGIEGRWWERFGDPKLNSLMEEALAANLGIAGAWARLDQARALVGAERSALFPRLDVTASRGRIKQRAISGVGPSITTDTFRLSAAAGYEIDLWRKLGSRTGAAKLEARATGEDLKTLYISLSAEVADLYFLIIEQTAQLELTDRTIEAFEDTLDRVERRYRAGLVPALDVYQSRQNLAGARAQRPVFAANLEAAEHALAVLMGRAPEEALPLASSALADPPGFAAGLPSDLLTRRPDLRAAYLRLAAADKRVAAAVADRFPSFSLSGELGGASTKLTDILQTPNIFWNVFVQAAMPVIDGARRRSEVTRSEEALRQALADYRQAVLNALKEVEDALSRSRATAERIAMLGQRVAASEGAHRLALDSYMQGIGDYLPVLDAQKRLFDARSALLEARRQLVSDRISLARALGGGWPDELVDKGPAEGKMAKERD